MGMWELEAIKRYACECCDKTKECITWFDGEYNNYICIDCLKRALKLIEEKREDFKGSVKNGWK